jgi:adenine phosphoribosyltransferase
MPTRVELLQSRIRDIPDFPKKGVMFKDITPLLKDGAAFKACIDEIREKLAGTEFDYVIGIEARGFILGAALAHSTGTGLVLARKVGKLPYEKISRNYGLEYGSATLELHTGDIEKGSRVVIVDDLLATGGTAEVTGEMAESLGAVVAAYVFLIELSSLKGRARLHNRNVISILKY